MTGRRTRQRSCLASAVSSWYVSALHLRPAQNLTRCPLLLSGASGAPITYAPLGYISLPALSVLNGANAEGGETPHERLAFVVTPGQCRMRCLYAIAACKVTISSTRRDAVNCMPVVSGKSRRIMSMLRIMSRNGDDRVTWDTQHVDAGDPEALAAVREAERIFREHRARGSTAFRIEEGHTFVRMDEFDPNTEQIIMVPRIVGG